MGLLDVIKKQWKYFTFTAIQSGYNFGLTCIGVLISPYMYQRTGMSLSLIAMVFGGLIPIVHIVVQPVVGVLSDIFPVKKIRRRFFIFVGILVAVLTLPVIPFSDYIGIACGDNESGLEDSINSSSNGSMKISISIGVVFSLFSSGSLVLMQMPSRALIADNIKKDEQRSANFFAALLGGFSVLVFYTLAATCAQMKYYYELMFVSAGVFILITGVFTILFSKENEKQISVNENTPLQDMKNESKEEKAPLSLEIVDPQQETMTPPSPNNRSKFQIVGKSLLLFIKGFGWKLMGLVFLQTTATCSVLVIGSSVANYYAINMFHAETTDPLYNYGISMSMVAMLLQSVVQCISSLLSPLYAKHENILFFGTAFVCALCHSGMIAVDYLSTYYDEPPIWLLIASFVLIGMVGTLGAVIQSVPYIIINKISSPKRFAIDLSFIGVVISVAFVLLSYFVSLLLSFGISLVCVFYIGAVLAILCTIGCGCLLPVLNAPTKIILSAPTEHSL
ncbi:hypothetical protein EIN_027060 [Entamoeba invadens IP1]|uniref:hypothetical protein n=1 Tax=Entamoeba invadens IP1 TaxID=370355 RepID=UPI0002C3E951|nr:hypothetical protein EIN_027060 [Entamoeba invadens IP1]ELP90817.1 hypothetical protein EIN_027060 [Entamoeba invadens IP1]|eukprot:XP_004257588.1 hypothetical protein EIN_027060 [Entamoeba invadens IP1]